MTNITDPKLHWQAKHLDHFADAERLLEEAESVGTMPSRQDDLTRFTILANTHARLAKAAAMKEMVILYERELNGYYRTEVPNDPTEVRAQS